LPMAVTLKNATLAPDPNVDCSSSLCLRFGSAHRSTWNAVFCDGSVHALSYGISLETHQALASRAASDTLNPKEY
jgi:hypothetical protein